MILKSQFDRWGLKASVFLHFVVFTVFFVAPFLPSFRKRPQPQIIDFTVVLDENLVEPNIPEEDAPPKEEDPPPEEETVPEDKPAVVVKEKKPDPPKPKPKPKPVEKPKPKPKPVEKPKPKPFEKGKRIEPKKVPEKSKTDFTKLKPVKPFDSKKPVSTKPVTDKKLSQSEINKALAMGARPGVRNQIPQDELSRCISLVRNALYETWEQPGYGDAGPRPTILEIRIDSTGRIVSYRITQSSGSAYFDRTVLQAAARTDPIRGLSHEFIRQYELMQIEFKLF